MEKVHIEKIIPYLIVVFLVTLFFALASFFPYGIDTDAAFGIKVAQQWLRGETRLLNTIRVPNPHDLSKDLEAWIVVYSPGIPVMLSALMALGLSLGFTLRLSAYIFFILGCLGYIKIADTIRANFMTKIILSLTLPMYALTIASVTVFIREAFVFGIMPWLFLYTLHFSLVLDRKAKLPSYILFHFCFLGFLLGSVYWLKYSASLISLALLSYLILKLLFFSPYYSLYKRLALLVSCVSCFLFPISVLNSANQYFAGLGYLDATKALFPHGFDNFTLHNSSFYIKLINLFSSLLGAPGLALYQTRFWLMHIIFWNDKVFPLFSSLKFYQRGVPLVVSGIPGTAIVVWLLFYSRKIFGKIIFIFASCVAFIPFILLAYITVKVKCNYLPYACYAYIPPAFSFLEILFISSFSRIFYSTKRTIIKFLLFLIFLVFFIVPNTFLLLNFIKNGIIERMGRIYIATENQLFQPCLSETNVKLVINKIESLVKSPKDIVILAAPDYNGESYIPWLEIKQRCLALGYCSSPFVHTLASDGVNLLSLQPYGTSQKLRVILVISKFLEEDGQTLRSIKQRFSQAKTWFHLADTAESDNLVSIWYADLKAA